MSDANADRRDVLARLLPTPFVSSFVGQAREGELTDADHLRRVAAWAQWAIASLDEFRGISDREYVALRLPGAFHDPLGNGPKVTPHLEVPRRVLDRPDPEFPRRLALAGNGLLFPWWLVSEVTAVKRAVFNTPRGPIAPLADDLDAHRSGLTAALSKLSAAVEPKWEDVETALVADPAALASAATADFDTSDLLEFFPTAAALQLRIMFDSQLREANGKWAARRVGVWQIRGVKQGAEFALGVTTPRLTTSSLFSDPLFNPAAEGTGALLVRLAIMRRVAKVVLSVETTGQVAADPSGAPVPGTYLRAVPARVGAKLPEASVEAAVAFLHAYPDAAAAWQALERWAQGGFLLTVSKDQFITAHSSAARFMRRLETPTRDDINVVLPLAWDQHSRVVRVTFSRKSEQE